MITIQLSLNRQELETLKEALLPTPRYQTTVDLQERIRKALEAEARKQKHLDGVRDILRKKGG